MMCTMDTAPINIEMYMRLAEYMASVSYLLRLKFTRDTCLCWHNRSQLQHANSASSLNLDCSSAIRSACITFKPLSMQPRPDDEWSSLTTGCSTPSTLNKSDKFSFKPRKGISSSLLPQESAEYVHVAFASFIKLPSESP